MESKVSADWVEDAIRQYILANRTKHPDIAEFVSNLGGLPLYVDWSGGVAIRPDGELIEFLWDEPESIKVEVDPRYRFIALFLGSRRYEELAALRPIRTAADRDCPICEGTGRLRELEEIGTTHILCYCGGAGWLPGEVPDSPAA
jgi:hypothetical protein